MFEQEVLFGNVVVPLLIVLIGCLPLAFRGRSASGWAAFTITVCGSLAIWAAFAIRIGFAWWPEDAWQKVPVAAMLVTSVALMAELITLKLVRTQRAAKAIDATVAERLAPSRSASDLMGWAAIAMSVVIAAWLIYPRGQAWDELQEQQYQWYIVMALGSSFGWWGIHGCNPRVASTVGLATIPLLIANAFMTSLSMMKVTEPLIAIATVLGLCSLIDFRLSVRRSLPLIIAPALFAMSGFIAHASFESYLHLPRTLYFLAMFSPAIIALVARMAQRKSTRFAVGLTVGLALMLAIAIGSWAYIAGEVSNAGEW